MIDSHQHFWKLGAFDYPWMSEELGILYQDFLPMDFGKILKANNVTHSVAVQASNSIEETLWLLDLAKGNEYIAGVVGWADLLSNNFEMQLSKLIKHPKLRGLRHLVQDEPDPKWIIQSQVLQSIRTLSKFDLTYDVLIFPQHLKYTEILAAECHETRLVIDHLAKPPIKSGEIEDWKEAIKRVSRYSNVFCKLSGLVTEADHSSWAMDDLRPYVDVALEAFGPKRLLFGSDYPVCLQASNYSNVLETYQELLSDLKDDEIHAIFNENARLFYKLGL